MRLGRYLQYSAYRETGSRTIGNLYLTLMQAAVIPSPKTIGQADANPNHPDLIGLLAESMA